MIYFLLKGTNAEFWFQTNRLLMISDKTQQLLISTRPNDLNNTDYGNFLGVNVDCISAGISMSEFGLVGLRVIEATRS